MHGIFGIYGVLIAWTVMEATLTRKEGITTKRFTVFMAFATFSIAVALGTLREAFEYGGDYLFNTQMVKGGFKDTMGDLYIKIFCAFITAGIYAYQQLKKQRIDP